MVHFFFSLFFVNFMCHLNILWVEGIHDEKNKVKDWPDGRDFQITDVGETLGNW
jgi:hypothetical protein